MRATIPIRARLPLAQTLNFNIADSDAIKYYYNETKQYISSFGCIADKCFLW